MKSRKGCALLAAIILALIVLVAVTYRPNTGGTPASNSGGTTAQNSPAGTAGPVAVGQPMTAKNGDAITVTAFTPNNTTGNQYGTPAPGKECVEVGVSFQNGSLEEWSYPTSEIAVVDAAGQKYDKAYIYCGSGDSITGIVAGGHATAKVEFEVPAGAPLNFTWVPNRFQSEVYQTKLR